MKKIIIAILALFSITQSCKEEEFTLPKPQEISFAKSAYKIYDKASPNSQNTQIQSDGTHTFVVELDKAADYDMNISLNTGGIPGIIKKYNDFKNISEYEILPSDYFDFTGSEITTGSTQAEVQLKVKNYENLPQGNYLLPILLNIGTKEVLHLVFVKKDVSFIPLSQDNKKPLPPRSYNCTDRTNPMKMVAYVETNDWDIRNMGQFLLKQSKKPVFDIVVLFAANMNYDAINQKRILFFNDKLKPIVDNPEIYIKPLQEKGIKVIIDILPNHQGVGYNNFQSYEEALAFAKEVKKATDKIGVDGWDIDEEYADYYKRPALHETGVQSYFWFAKAMKEVMPDKLLTLYDYGHPLREHHTDENGRKFSDYVDYCWANYGEYFNYVGFPKNRYGGYSIEATRGGLTEFNVRRSAQNNLSDCNQLFMLFNISGRDIKNGNATRILSTATKLLYGDECEFVGKYHRGPKD